MIYLKLKEKMLGKIAEINAYHTDIIEYAYKKNVRIASPTTLISVLTVIQVMMTNLERDKYANIIQQELEKLNVEFTRYRTRWDNLQKDIEKVSKDVKEINTTSNKPHLNRKTTSI